MRLKALYRLGEKASYEFRQKIINKESKILKLLDSLSISTNVSMLCGKE
jgi:hypothetical protein